MRLALRPLVFFFALVCVLPFSAFAAVPVSEGTAASAASVAGTEAPAFLEGRVLVKFKQGAGASVRTQSLQKARGALRASIARTRFDIIAVPKGEEEKVREALARDPNVESAELDYLLAPQVVPNDPLYSSQWFSPLIGEPQAWDMTTGSPSVIIAILDSGIDQSHPDLSVNLVPGFNFVSNTANTAPDACPHGTAVAGAAGAVGNNAQGVAGVSWNSKLMSLVIATVSTGCSAPLSGVASAITYAADHGARVINISYGGSGEQYNSSAVQSAVDYAWGKGALIFAAAGNSNVGTATYPAAHQNVIAVAATAPTGSSETRANYSNFGNWVDLSAPGSQIPTPDLMGSAGYAPGDYATVFGTSFASPIAAGLAALILSADPTLTNAAVEGILKQSVDDLGASGFDIYYGQGRVNAAKALALALPPSVTLKANGEDALVLPSPQGWMLTWSSANVSSCIMSYNTPGGSGSFGITPNTSGSGGSGSTGSYTLTCKNSAGQSVTKTVTIAVVAASLPTISLAANGVDNLVLTSGSWMLTWSSSNASSCTMSYATPGGNGSYGITPNTSGSGGSGATGSYTLTCKNAAGQSVTKTVTISLPPLPTVSLAANGVDNLVLTSGSWMLTWSSSNASSCTMSYNTPGGSGSFGITPNSSGSGGSGSTGSYTLTCKNSAGQSATKTVTISLPALPTVSLAANGQDALVLPSPQSWMLTWSSSNASSCTIVYNTPGGSGSFGITPNTSGSGGSGSTGSYTLTCKNSAGQSATKTVTISLAGFGDF